MKRTSKQVILCVQILYKAKCYTSLSLFLVTTSMYSSLPLIVQQPGSDIRNFFGGKGGGGASSANGPSVGEASGSGSDTVSSSAKGSSAHKEGSGKAKAIIFSKEGAKASGASSSSPSPLGPQARQHLTIFDHLSQR